ncbi:adenylyltransferase/cytidyltransferase family protein [bacterium]|nr:adenylyltransferase/cytidyltransferase family protein [bacterium]
MRSTLEKILSLEELTERLTEEREQGRRIVHCHGVFDLLHPGHIHHLKSARKLGDLLVVTVTPDPFVNKGPGRPIFRQELRVETLSTLEYVDYVALNLWPTAVETIRRLKPHIYVKGKEYANAARDVTGKISEEAGAVEEVGGRIVFTDGETFSSSHLINRFFSPYPPATDTFLREFRKIHSADDVIENLKRLSALRVMVVGEAIIDEYCYCNPLGKSPKETIVATRFLQEERFAGGALATANHLANFCERVTLVTPFGQDPRDIDFVRSKMHPGVDLRTLTTDNRPTVIKRRYVEPAFMTKMFEIQYLDDRPMSAELEEAAVSIFEERAAQTDLIVVNDFGHGFLTERLRRWLAGSGKFLAVNAQTNSANHGFNPVTKYERADYVCIDEPELHLASGTRYRETHHLAMDLKRKMKAHYLTVSRGPEGCVVLNNRPEAARVPVMSTRVIDRTGAGDALFAVTSPCVYREFDPVLLGFIGNCVGALAVETVCNREPIRAANLFKFISALLK